VFFDASDIDLGPAEAFRAAGRQLRRQRQTGVVHGVFPRGPGALAPVRGILVWRNPGF
jgi:hypothetical protein